MSDTNELRAALIAARECIELDRTSLADSHMDPLTNMVDEDGASGVAEYDEVLAKIDAALAAPTAPAAGPQHGEAVAWCAMTPSGKIAYFDGKPMVMPGPVGNYLHPVALVVRHPAPAVERGVTEALRDAITRMECARNVLTNGTPTPECNWGMLDTTALRAALTATGAAQGDGVRLVYGETEVSAPGAAIRAVQFHLTDAGAAALNVPAQQEAPAAQPLTSFTPKQRRRLWANSPEVHKDATSIVGFERIVTLTERAHGIQPAATKGTT